VVDIPGMKLNTNIHVVANLKGMVFYPMHPYVFMVYALDQIKFCCKIECSLPVLKLRIVLNEEWLKLEESSIVEKKLY
jgi:hypothetical protein